MWVNPGGQMNNVNIAQVDKFDPDLIFDQIGILVAQNRLLREQLLHVNKRIDEEATEKLLWRESAEYWQIQAEFFIERLQELKTEGMIYAI